jgi:nickel-dependent lactate racemase
MYSQGSVTNILSDASVGELLASACAELPVDGKRVLVLIPDATRNAPIPLLFRWLYACLGARTARLDYLIALGTHPAMSPAAVDRLVGVSAEVRAEQYPNVRIYNHAWDRPEALTTIGTIDAHEVEVLTGALQREGIAVTLNRLILEYDLLIICGPVFPHEVIGFSGGAKYLFPGIAGPDIINATHWLGSLATSMHTIGHKDTAVRRLVHRAAEFVPRPVLCIALVVKGAALHGMYVGNYVEAWSAAADLSEQLEIVHVPRAFRRVLSIPSRIYDDLWTGAKAMYKTEPAIADGGEVIIYAPHLTEVSYTHGALIDDVGYHVRDYFLRLGQPDRFAHVPGMIKAHSTHVKGAGTFDTSSGREEPRIQVTLATSIPEERCRRINLGYLDYRAIDVAEWEGREDEGILVVHNAGEVLYRAPELVGLEPKEPGLGLTFSGR